MWLPSTTFRSAWTSARLSDPDSVMVLPVMRLNEPSWKNRPVLALPLVLRAFEKTQLRMTLWLARTAWSHRCT